MYNIGGRKIFAFEISAFGALAEDEICLTFIEVFCGLRGAYPPNTYCQKFENCADGLQFESVESFHCLGYLAGTDLVKLSWRLRFKLRMQSSGRS